MIAAGGDIVIRDTSIGDDGDDWKQDPEIVAGGEHGRIDLESPGKIELFDDVQLHAHQVTNRYPTPESVTNPIEPELSRSERAVFLSSDAIAFRRRSRSTRAPIRGWLVSLPLVRSSSSTAQIPTIRNRHLRSIRIRSPLLRSVFG